MDDWFETMSGCRCYAMRAEPHFTIEDIIFGLARTCRFGGQLRRDVEFYSVAEHSLLVTDVAARLPRSRKELRTALMHDAAEALIGDMVRPLKKHLPDFSLLEDKLQCFISACYGLIWPMPDWLKTIDTRILVDERAAVMPASGNPWLVDVHPPLGVTIKNYMPFAVAELFAARLRELGIDSKI